MESPEATTSAGQSDASPSGCKFVDQERAGNLLKGMAVLYGQKQFCDVTLIVDDSDFMCHKNVLAISSPFFMAMFSTDFSEGRQDKIQIKEMNSQTMELILDYIYTGEVTLAEDTVQNLLSASNLFQLISLRNGCADYMIKHVDIPNCIGVYFFAKAHQCDQLADRAKEIINKKFNMLCKEHEFLSLPSDKVVEIIRDDAINVLKEEVVYEACLAWLNYSLDERKAFIVDIMRCVRFANISSYYFCDKVDSHKLLYESPELKRTLNTVKYYHMLKNRQGEIDLNYLPRRGMTYERGLIVMANPHNEDSTRKFNTMEMLLPKTGEIKHLCKLPQGLYMPASCISGDNQIFLAGGAFRKSGARGSASEGVSSNLFMYDKHFGSWQVKAKMHFGRSQFCLVMVDGSVFAIGGQNNSEIIKHVERYDQQQNTWVPVAPLPQPLRCMASVSYKGKLFLFGGESDKEITKTSYRYDPVDDAWLELPPMQIARALAGCVVYRDQMYVIGGNSSISSRWKKELLPEDCVSSVEVFDPATNTWSFGPELPTALCGAGVVKYGGTILVVGGEDDKSWMAGLFSLKEENGKLTWVEGHELPTVMSTFGCVVANIVREHLRERDEL